MAPELLAALLAAISALIVALVGVVTAILTSKSTSRTAKELELLKHDLDEQSKWRVETKERRDERTTALRECIRALQMAKDELRLIQTHYPDALDDEEATKRAISTRDYMLKTNQKYQEELYEQRELFHEAKNLILEVDRWYSDEVRTNDAWRELDDMQGKLRDALTGVIINEL